MTKYVDSLKSLVATKFENQIHSISYSFFREHLFRLGNFPYIILHYVAYYVKFKNTLF